MNFWVAKIRFLDFVKSEYYERLSMNILKNIRFQQFIIESAEQNITNSIAEIANVISELPNTEAHAYGTRLAITRADTPMSHAVISLERYNSVDDLVKNVSDWDFQTRARKLTEFDHLQGLLSHLNDIQTSLQTQLQKIVDGYNNKNPQLFIEVVSGGISLIHRNHQVESSQFIHASDITSKDKFNEIVNRFLDKF